MLKERTNNYSLTYPKIVAIGFALLVFLGSALLMLPISTKTAGISYIDALFTATSATCITGLVPFDTFSTWSVFGQLVILSLIQIGGLGFITILAILVNLPKKKMSLKQKMLLKESIGSVSLGETKKLFQSVIIFTASCEGVGAVLLSTRFIPLAGVRRGIYMSIFTSISAFCNAGFDLMGMFSKSSSLTTVNDDPVILITVMLLIVFGGLGFFVWDEMRRKGFKLKRFSAYTKLVLTITGALIIIGAVLFLLCEAKTTLADMPWWQKLLNAFFCSITPRTAGFNSVDIAAMSGQGRALTIFLMLIGGSTGSTAGGIKTTTFAILVFCMISNIRNREDVEIFGKRVNPSVVKNAVSITLTNIMLIFVACTILSFAQPSLAINDIIYECTSAMGTVGITTGITPQLNTISALTVCVLMYVGRLTSMIFALSFVTAKAKKMTNKPLGEFMVG